MQQHHHKAANDLPESSMHLLIKGSNGLSMYWMHVEGDSNAKLRDLDAFLRGIWVECCGHLSMFEIDDETYSVEPQKEYDDRSMIVKLGSVLREGMKFSYEYDFGTTTSLDLKVVSTHHPSWLSEKDEKFELLARNDQPAIRCGDCGKGLATNGCSDCISEGEKGWLCDDCSEKHECGEEMLLPVVNSPRVGMCGYTG
ncbi:MAG: IS1096 element passenger TnpR family protein [Nitrososphaerales archaeon]